MIGLSFTNPYYLFFLFLIPVFIFVHVVSLKVAKNRALKFANFEAISRIKGVDFFSKNISVFILSEVILTILVLSASGVVLNADVFASTHSFVIALDNSKSMEANDLTPNRMEAAKKAAKEFIEQAPFITKFGAISFSGSAFIEEKVSDSKLLIKNSIDNIQISDVGGTDLYEAVVTSTNLLISERSKAIVLVSDGQINVGNIDDAVKYAKDNNVVISTIVIGNEEGGETSYGISRADSDSLRALAENTGGSSFFVNNNEQLEQSFFEAYGASRNRVAIPLSGYFNILAVILFSLQFILINTRYRRIP